MTVERVVFVVEFGVNAAISVAWALAALRLARRERLRWPVPWRFLVADWMGSKAALFALIFASLIANAPAEEGGDAIPHWLTNAVAAWFTVAHVWAFWRWLHLPEAEDRPGETDDKNRR